MALIIENAQIVIIVLVAVLSRKNHSDYRYLDVPVGSVSQIQALVSIVSIKSLH
jgi:hypothetical protein